MAYNTYVYAYRCIAESTSHTNPMAWADDKHPGGGVA